MDIVMNNRTVIGTLGSDGKVNYNQDAIKAEIKEMIAGQSGKTSGHFNTTASVSYRYDTSRKKHADNMYTLWKKNPILDNRVRQLNALIFGKGLKWIYDDNTKKIIDRFWRVNRLMGKLNAIGTDAQLYGEIFIGLYPQSSGDVLLTVYESRQVDIDFDPANTYRVNRYIVTYKDDESGKEEQFDMMPIENYLNEIEFSTGVNTGIIAKVRKSLGLTGATKVKGGKGVMCHIKFNNCTAEINGTSDFFQIGDVAEDYIDFAGDRFTTHQLYGSPSYDITIDSDDPQVIQDRIDELAGFGIGSNPVHNTKETWKPLEFTNGGGISPSADDKIFRGLLCAGTGFPEFMLFNQGEQSGGDDNTFSVTKLAQDRQRAFGEAFADIHKFAVAIGGGDISLVDEGQIIFPEIDTMSEKTKAETYVLKVGANICSRRTAAMNMGHSWDNEKAQIMAEAQEFGELTDSPDFAGAMAGRFTSRQNNAASDNADGADHGDRDRSRRADVTNVQTSQVISNDKKKY